MKFPVVFEAFGHVYHYHYLFELLAFFVGIRLYYFLKSKITDPISEENRLWIMVGAMFGALIGSRVVAILEEPAMISNLTFAFLYESKTIAGGLLGGLFGVELIKRIIGVKIASGDVYVIPIIAALFIGRIGCFLMGVDEPVFGIETTFFTGMDLGDGLRRHPVALYEMGYMVVLLIVFICLRKKLMINGERFKLFMVLYFLWRFITEFIKPYHALFFGLSSIHWSALFIFLYYYKFIIRTLRLS